MGNGTTTRKLPGNFPIHSLAFDLGTDSTLPLHRPEARSVGRHSPAFVQRLSLSRYKDSRWTNATWEQRGPVDERLGVFPLRFTALLPVARVDLPGGIKRKRKPLGWRAVPGTAPSKIFTKRWQGRLVLTAPRKCPITCFTPRNVLT